MRLPTRSPFLRSEELSELHQLLFNPHLNLVAADAGPSTFDQQRTRGLELVSLYLNRSNCPHAIESTAFLIQSQILDHNLHGVHNEHHSSSFFSSSQADISSRLSYSISMIRFVNSIVDSEQNGFYAQSINSIAQRIGLPLAFVELRHASTHEELPSLQSFRQATAAALEWLDVHYWRPTLNSLCPQPRTNPGLDRPIASTSSHIYASSASSSAPVSQEQPSPSEPFKISSESISRLRTLLKTYKKISKLISKDFSLRGSLNREIGEVCKEIEDWIRDVGQQSFHYNTRTRNTIDAYSNPNLIEIAEQRSFNPDKFNRKRRRGEGLEFSDQEELLSNEREAARRVEITKLGLKALIKELLQLGGLVPLGMGKRMVFRVEKNRQDAVINGKGKEKEAEVGMSMELEEQEEMESSKPDGSKEPSHDLDEEGEDPNFTSNGIQILSLPIIAQWSILLNQLSSTFKDFFTPLLISEMIDCLGSGVPSLGIEGMQDVHSISQPKTILQQPFPKGYKETICSWLIHLSEARKTLELSYGLGSASGLKGWEAMERCSTKDQSVRSLKNSELDFRKPKNRLTLCCLSSQDRGKSALPILKYLASNANSSLTSGEKAPPSSSGKSSIAQDEILSKFLRPLIQNLEAPESPPDKKYLVANQAQPLEVQSSANDIGTGFEDSLGLMRERLESLGKKSSPQVQTELESKRDQARESEKGVKRARFLDDVEHNDTRDEGMDEEDQDDDGEDDAEDEGDEDENQTDQYPAIDSRAQDCHQNEEEACSMIQILGWRLPSMDEWKPTPIGMLRGELPDLELRL